MRRRSNETVPTVDEIMREFESGSNEVNCKHATVFTFIAQILVIEDCHYGLIEAPEPMQTLIDTFPVQRLRSIKMTGPAHFVFPCMTHTRFAHSLG